MKNRLEDLGRIRELLDSISQHEVFSLIEGRLKDFHQNFENLPNERKHDLLCKLAHGISDLESQIANIFIIARGDKESWED